MTISDFRLTDARQANDSDKSAFPLVFGNNLRRNITFRDSGDKASHVAPVTTMAALGSDSPRNLRMGDRL
jgi:hypothetical protein